MASDEKKEGTWPNFALWSQRLWQGNEDCAASKPLPPALYLIATPIGNLGDITLRGLWTLAHVDTIFCEDTRVTGGLLRLYGLPKKKMISCHDYNEKQRCKDVLDLLAQGNSAAFVSDAGTPALSDPGYRLVCACREAGYPVFSLPGASALLTALVCAGLPTNRFAFAGFPPPKSAARLSFFQELLSFDGTLIFYETGPRLHACLADMTQIFGGTREAVVARELTKLYESVEKGTLEALYATTKDAPVRKGEFVLLLAPNTDGITISDQDIDKALKNALTQQSLRDAVTLVAQALNVKKTVVYQRALILSHKNRKD